MEFHPCNRHLLVSEIKEDLAEEKSMVLLPEDYRPAENEYVAVDILNLADDCTVEPLVVGDVAIVEKSMLREVNFFGSTHQIVLENYVLGIFIDDDGEALDDDLDGWEN